MTQERIHLFQYLGGRASEIFGWSDARAAYCVCNRWLVEATWIPPSTEHDLPGLSVFDDDVHGEFLKHLQEERNRGSG